MSITPELFVQAGEALFGHEWKRPLAVALAPMNERTVFRIAKAAREGASYPIHHDVGPALAALLREKVATESRELLRLAKQLEG